MEPTFDVQAMIDRFTKRAAAVRSRGLPPVEGEERQRIREQMELDYMDFAIMADSKGEFEDGVLKFTIDLRKKSEGDSAS